MDKVRENRSNPSGASRTPDTLTREEYRIALEATRPEFSEFNEIVFELLVGQGDWGLSPHELAGHFPHWESWEPSNGVMGNLAKRIQRALPPLKLPVDRDGTPFQFSAICEYDEVDGGVPWVLRRPLLEAASDLGLDFEPVDEEDPIDESPQASALEGGVKFCLHRRRERAPGLRRKKLDEVLAATGRPACEICDSDCSTPYGPDAEFCFEVHHRRPLSELRGMQRTQLEDLAVLCVLCHRFIHSLRELPPVEEARGLLDARSSRGVR